MPAAKDEGTFSCLRCRPCLHRRCSGNALLRADPRWLSRVVVTFVLTVLCIGSALIVAQRARGGLLDFLGCVTHVSLLYAGCSRSRLKRA